MTIIDYSKSNKDTLANMMTAYMAELDCGIPENVIREKLVDFIDGLCGKGIIRVVIVFHCDTPAAFSVFQIDTPESDWCKRPGWGFIREFYVIPEYRKNGIGRQLSNYTEQALRTMGAAQLYLTSTDAIPFWKKCGWKVTGDLCSNDQYILEK